MAVEYLTESSQSYAASFVAEDEVIAAARARGEELGCTPIGPAGGAVLRLIAQILSARNVVEVGTGAGVSGLWLLAGMRQDGVLTTVDTEPEHQRATRQAFTEAGVATTRYRLINGTAAEVLPRLTDGGYDLVFVDADKTGYGAYHEQAVRLLRPGGVVAFDNVLWHNRAADNNVRDADTVALRELARAVREDDRLTPALLPVGDGLLLAAKR
jgi:predicted O-methyltransferase YrrM